jgi:hypothetical protein
LYYNVNNSILLKGELAMRCRNIFLCIAAMAMVLVVTAGLCAADTTLGVNFCDASAGPHLAGEVADGFGNWTDSFPVDGTGSAATGTGLVVLGSGGSVTCSWTSANTWYAGAETTSDQQLYRVYIDDTTGITVTITGLNAWLTNAGLAAYTIRIYQSTDAGVGFTAIDINSGATTLQTVQETNHWTTDGGIRAYVDSGNLSADTITLVPQARTGNGGGDTRATIAGFRITGVDKFIPINPVPANGSEAPIDQVLSWGQAAAASGLGVTYNVYFGTEPNTLNPNYYGNHLVKTTTTDSADFFYDPTPDMTNSTTYYWRVDAIEPNVPTPVVHTGPEWSFITQPLSARIDTDPVSQTVPAGTAQVQFTVAGINITTYQWYKDGVVMADDPTDALYIGENGPTLTIYDVQLADEGFYYCQADNSLIQPDTSVSAQLLTARLVGWWKLDGNLTDSVATVEAGAVTHNGTSVDPNYVVTGKDGGAIQFYGDADSIVTITNSADYFNFYPRGFTVSAWVNMPAKTTWDVFVCKEGPLRDRGFSLSHQGAGQAVFTLRQSFNDLVSGVEVDNDNWHLVVGNYDAATTTGKVYVDGVLAAQTTNTGAVLGNPGDLFFGAEAVDASVAAYTGLLDDVRIWDYAVDPVTVAALYVDLTAGSKICVENPTFDIAGPDGVGNEFRDCIVNLYDFAAFAGTWLDCNTYPASDCGL